VNKPSEEYRSYPAHLVRSLSLNDGTTITLRPIRPADAMIEHEFVRGLSGETRYFRFMDSLRELSAGMLKHLTHIDYCNHMALIAVATLDGEEVEVAVARYIVADDGETCEFAIVVGDAWQRHGIATALMKLLIEAARERRIKTMTGEVLSSNNKMLRFIAKLGFSVEMDAHDAKQVCVSMLIEPIQQ